MTDAGLVFLLQFLFFFSLLLYFMTLFISWLFKDMKDWWTEVAGIWVMVVSMVSVYLPSCSIYTEMDYSLFFSSGTCSLVRLSCRITHV